MTTISGFWRGKTAKTITGSEWLYQKKFVQGRLTGTVSSA
jgi:hypothetical protein